MYNQKKYCIFLCFFMFLNFLYQEDNYTIALGNCPPVHFLKRAYSEKELNDLLHIGMSKDEAVKKFGKPFYESTSAYDYLISPSSHQDQKDGELLNTGFILFFKEDKLVSWDISYGYIEKKDLSTSSQEKEYHKIFIQQLYTKDDLVKILKLGISKADVIKEFGVPLFENKVNDLLLAYYKINPELIPCGKEKLYVAAFYVGFENDKLKILEVHYKAK